jgi:hypothetical protein
MHKCDNIEMDIGVYVVGWIHLAESKDQSDGLLWIQE